MKITISTVLLVVFAWGCATSDLQRSGRATAQSDWPLWKEKRLASLGNTNGWSTLIMLHWLKEGVTTIGSAPTNRAILPTERAPAQVGTFIRSNETVRFLASPGIKVSLDGKLIESATLNTDTSPEPSKIRVGEISIVVIERGDRLGLRAWDPQAPTRVKPGGLNYFAYDPAWRIEGRFEPFPFPRTLRVADVIDGTQDYRSPGTLVFIKDGVEHRLDVTGEPDDEEYFIMFHDQTAGDTTYPPGRFLYVSKPETDGKVIIDFNRAYTPPCGFTPFATCPLPPRQNFLKLAVTAGELTPPGHH